MREGRGRDRSTALDQNGPIAPVWVILIQSLDFRSNPGFFVTTPNRCRRRPKSRRKCRSVDSRTVAIGSHRLGAERDLASHGRPQCVETAYPNVVTPH